MLFDEPEAGIDLWSFTGLIDVFRDLRSHLDGSLVIISHQERILAIADEIVVIADGVVQQAGPRALCARVIGRRSRLHAMSQQGGWKTMNGITEKLLGIVSDWAGLLQRRSSTS